MSAATATTVTTRAALRPRRSPRIAALAALKAKKAAEEAELLKKKKKKKPKKNTRTTTTTTKSSSRKNKKRKTVEEEEKVVEEDAETTTKAAAAASSPKSKKKRMGLKKSVKTTDGPMGVVDPDSNIDGSIEFLDSEACDVMLCLIDPAKNMDKFFVLQLIRQTSPFTNGDGEFVVYSRWGRTGTAGQGLGQYFGTFDEAVDCFEKKFKQKTGLDWTSRGESTMGGKYRFIQQDFTQKRGGYKSAKWQYWVDDGVDGKTTGWYDYDTSASTQVERLFAESSRNKDLKLRSVASGSFMYSVDLSKMLQTNVTHASHTTRRIRRFEL